MRKDFYCPRKDCFAYDKSGCKALSIMYEDMNKCKFYKSKVDNSNQIKELTDRKRRELRFGKGVDFIEC